MAGSLVPLPDTIGDGNKNVTTAGTAVVLSTSVPCKKVTITAKINNTGLICVGGSTVVAAQSGRRGTPLLPGDSLSLEISNVGLIYIDSTVNGEGVTYTYLN